MSFRSGAQEPCTVFFSSRRRHTSCSGDWSSDVCSSDLDGFQGSSAAATAAPPAAPPAQRPSTGGETTGRAGVRSARSSWWLPWPAIFSEVGGGTYRQIGRRRVGKECRVWGRQGVWKRER